MSVGPTRRPDYIEDRIGHAISKADKEKLLEIKQEVETLLTTTISEEHRTFFRESTELIQATLMNMSIDIHEMVKPESISTVNNKVLEVAKQHTEVYQAILTTFSDPDLAANIDEGAATSYDTIPRSEIYVNPQLTRLKALEKEFETTLPDHMIQSEGTTKLLESFTELHQSFMKLNVDVVAYLRGKISMAEQDKIAGTPALKIEAAERYLRNVLLDDKSGVQEISDAELFEGRIFGDGNCGFSSTNTTREEVVRYLKTHADDDHIRALVAPEIAGWLKLFSENQDLIDSSKEVDAQLRAIVNSIEKQIGAELKLELKGVNAEEILLDWNTYKSQLNQAEALTEIDIDAGEITNLRKVIDRREKVLHDLSHSQEVFKQYVNTYYERGYLVLPDPGSTGVLNVIAEWKKSPIRVWKIDTGTENTAYLRYQTDRGDLSQALDIIHRSLHFNKLIPPKGKGFSEPMALGTKKKFAPMVIYGERLGISSA